MAGGICPRRNCEGSGTRACEQQCGRTRDNLKRKNRQHAQPAKLRRTAGEKKMKMKPKTKSKLKQTRRRPVPKASNALYPALATWGRRQEHPRKHDTWTFDTLWGAACCEAEAADYAKNHPKRERESQREAIAIMLGVPPKDVKLDLEWQKQYLAAIEKASA